MGEREVNPRGIDAMRFKALCTVQPTIRVACCATFLFACADLNSQPVDVESFLVMPMLPCSRTPCANIISAVWTCVVSDCACLASVWLEIVVIVIVMLASRQRRKSPWHGWGNVSLGDYNDRNSQGQPDATAIGGQLNCTKSPATQIDVSRSR